MSHDEYGNRWSQTYTQGSGTNQSFLFDQTTNRLVSTLGSAANTPWNIGYDGNGNQTNDTLHSYSYDTDNNVTQVDGGNTATYDYDAMKHRTMVQTSAGTTLYGYDVDGHRFGSWTGNQSGLTLTGFNVFWGNRLLATFRNGHAYYQHVDALGTVRATTDETGTLAGIYQSLPFGDSSAIAGTDTDPQHFAQLDRDGVTDTHNANFRMYHAAQGRWLSPDPFRGSYDVSDPQSFNRYAYALNRPLSAIDPSGLDTGWYGSCHGDYDYCTTVTTDEPWGEQDWSYDGWYGLATAPPPQGPTSDASDPEQNSSGKQQNQTTSKSPEECQKLLDKIDNLINATRPPGDEKGIAQRFRQFDNSTLNPRGFSPGPYSDQGHSEQLGMRQAQLMKAINDYKQGCGDPPGSSIDMATRPIASGLPRGSVYSPKQMSPVAPVVVVGGVIVITVVVCPECLIAGSVVAAF